MTNDELKKLEAALDKSCRQHLANGGRLIRGRFWEGTNGACPIRATVNPLPAKGIFRRFLAFLQSFFAWKSKEMELPNLPYLSDDNSYEAKLSRAVGFVVPHNEMMILTQGYDGGYFEPGEGQLSLYNIGERLAAKYKPETIP